LGNVSYQKLDGYRSQMRDPLSGYPDQTRRRIDAHVATPRSLRAKKEGQPTVAAPYVQDP
jgi:hypothetical protein